MLRDVPVIERLVDRGTRRGRLLIRRLGEEIRAARLAAGLSQRQLGLLVGLSHSTVSRIERGEVAVDVLTAARISAVLGLELSLGTHPVGSPARDRAHLALLERLRLRLHPDLSWQTEVPLPQGGDLRALDAFIGGLRVHAMVEAETRLTDVQATERKIRLKQRDSGIGRVILLLADTRHNRTMVDASPGLRRAFTLTTRQILAALARSDDPGADGIVFL